MQEKVQLFSPIKQKILQFVDNLGISKREFYKLTGISRGTLEAKSGITEDTLAKILAKYPEISAEWLLRDEGEMLRSVVDQSGDGGQRLAINGNGNSHNTVSGGEATQELVNLLREQLTEKDAQLQAATKEKQQLLNILTKN